tara:strand:- start:460 stop:1845 length:1386 start_codon:yes stop_codon:yes gene_type:complete
MISVIDIVFQKRNIFFMNKAYKILWLIVILLFISSCSPKPEPEPKPVAKVKSKKPSWTNGKIKSSGEWYGYSSGKIADTLDLEKAAKDLINKQVYEKIKETIKHELDLSEEVLVKISNHAIAFRSDIIKDLIKKSDSYNDGIKKYVLLSLDKKNYQNAIRKRLESSNIEQILGSIKGHPKKQNFLKLSKAINIIAGSIDIIINDTKLSNNTKTNVLIQVRQILDDYNERILFKFDPQYLNSIPISNDQKTLKVKVIDKIENLDLDSLQLSIEFNDKFPSESIQSSVGKRISISLPKSISGNSYYINIGVDYKNLFGGDYLDIFSIKQNSKRITVLPKNIRMFSNESISTLGTGLEYSAVYDSIKKCFSQNYGLEFVKNIDDADLIMDIEVTTKENMRRESRKHPFKSEAFFILYFKYSKTNERMFSHIIANAEAVDYDFVERASIKSLKELSSKAIKNICQ